MRPVNLIPPNERRGDAAPLRMGNLIYVLTGGLALLLLLIVAVALTGKQVSQRETQKASLEAELQQTTARAQSVQAFTAFRTVQQERSDTVASLAQSRFDWARILQEVSLVLPSDVTLSSLKGTVSPDVQMESGGAGGGAEGSDLRSQVAGPALEIVGCAPSQDAVAGFISALEDIDGVTRVGMDSSKLPDQSAGGEDAATAGSSGGSGASGECQSGPNTAKFQLIAAFDAVATPAAATTSPSVPSPTPATGGDQSQVADGQTQENVQRASVREQTSKAEKAKSTLIPGG
jgi:Tfp pilus assembly protein PilN